MAKTRLHVRAEFDWDTSQLRVRNQVVHASGSKDGQAGPSFEAPGSLTVKLTGVNPSEAGITASLSYLNGTTKTTEVDLKGEGEIGVTAPVTDVTQICDVTFNISRKAYTAATLAGAIRVDTVHSTTPAGNSLPPAVAEVMTVPRDAAERSARRHLLVYGVAGAGVAVAAIGGHLQPPVLPPATMSEGLGNLPNLEWIKKGGALALAVYALLALTVAAAVVERLVETLMSARRATRRVVLEEKAAHGKRAYTPDKKNVAVRNAMLDANIALATYKDETRARTMSLSFLLGCIIAAACDFPLFEAFLGDASGTAANLFFYRFAEIVACGGLIAGGAEPMHAMIGGLQKSLKKLASPA